MIRMKNKLTFSLNYRKPKSDYKKNEELIICIRQYSKQERQEKGKVRKISTGVKCKLKDWNPDWHLTKDRMPIKSSDPEYKKKNRKLKEMLISFDQEKHSSNNPKLSSNEPSGPIADKWTKHKNDIKLVNPANKRNIDIIVVGTGLALSLIHI